MKMVPPTSSTSSSSSSSTDYVDVASEMFHVVCPAQRHESAASTGMEPMIHLAHVEVLAQHLHVCLEDFSVQILAFLMRAAGGAPYSISKTVFVAYTSARLREEMEPVAGAQPTTTTTTTTSSSSSKLLTADDDYAAGFAMLHDDVVRADAILRRNSRVLYGFYCFLYAWCLQDNRGTDRHAIMIEIWSAFFYDDERSACIKDARYDDDDDVSQPRPRAHYRYFRNWKLWRMFVNSSSFRQRENLRDMWQMLFSFADITDYTTYSIDESWPIAMDEYVMWHAQRAKMQLTDDDDDDDDGDDDD